MGQSSRPDNNKRVEFKSGEHRHFDHGYAVTSHSSQVGKAERVLVDTDTRVHPDPINSRFRYVSISCTGHESTVFIDDVARLNMQLNADTSKSLGFTIAPGPAVAKAKPGYWFGGSFQLCKSSVGRLLVGSRSFAQTVRTAASQDAEAA